MYFPKWQLILALLAILGFLRPHSMQAQTFRGGINGTVSDPSGAVIPNAAVVAKDKATGLEYKSVSTSDGQFSFQDLPLGTYSVAVVATGFPPVTVDGVPVIAGTIYTLPVKLSIANQSTTVEVAANAIALDTTTETQTTTVGGALLQDLPMNGRDFGQLVVTAPGFGGYAAGGNDGSINGTRGNQLNWQIDGSDNNELWHNIAAVNQPGVSAIAGSVLPLDAVEEFSVQTQSSAETGRNPGGTVNLVIKSGTNQIHGSLYYFNRNEALAKGNPFLFDKQEVRNDQFGGSVGGPIIKDRTFYFASFEKQKFTIGVPGTATVPSQAYQAQALQLMQNPGGIYGAYAPVAVNPVSQNLLNALWPSSAQSRPAGPDNYVSDDPEFGFSYNGIAKIDHRINSKNNLSVRWFGGEGNQVAPVGTNIKWYFEGAPLHVQNYAVVLNTALSSHLTNQLVAGVNYFNQVFYDFNSTFEVKDQGLFLSPSTTIAGAPNLRITGFDQTGRTPPLGRNGITGHLTDTVSYVVGRHELRFGGEYRNARLQEYYHRQALGRFQFDSESNGTAPWANVDPSLLPNQDSNVKDLADFMAGYVYKSSIAIGDPVRQVYVNSYDLFAQDAWQVNSKLSLNYGLRYDYAQPFHDSNKDLSTFIPSQGGLVFQGAGISNLYPPDRNNFAPRLGFAFRPRMAGSLVVRGGLGLYYDVVNLNPFLDNRPGNDGPNGVESNPAGATPVSTILINGYTLPTDNSYIFPATGPTCASGNGCGQTYGIFSVSQKFRSAYFYEYNLNVEKAFGNSVLWQVGYVGNEGRHLLTLADINQVNISNGLQPYANQFPNFGVINEVGSNGTSNYNALQTTLKIKTWHRLSSQLNYTWGHAFDDATQYRGYLPQDSYNLKGDYGNSSFDTRNNFTAVLTYDLPHSSRGPNLLVNGWQLSSLLSFRSGVPFNITTDEDTSGTDEGFQRPNLIGDPFAGVSHKIALDSNGQKYIQWINPAAFAQPAVGTFGDLPRNAFYGGGYSAVDFSIFKTTSITERIKIQFRVEFFNLFNHNNYAPPNVNPVDESVGFGNSGFGQIRDTVGDFNGAPGIGPGEPFNVQLALKVLF
jgi:hypothetical protein